MIFGDPYELAFVVEVVPEWSTADFSNGVMFVLVNGITFPKVLCNSTIVSDTEAILGRKRYSPALSTYKDNERIFSMDAKEAFFEMFNLTTAGALEPESDDDIYIENDYSYNATPTGLSDLGCYIFAVGQGDEIRIIAGQFTSRLQFISRNSPLELSEIVIKKTCLKETLRKIDEFSSSLTG